MGIPAVIGFTIVLGTACLAGATAPAHAAETDVTIYRCTDAGGTLTLRDTPCAKGQQQETRSMLRPVDASARPVLTPPAPQATVPTPPPTRVVVISAPRPLYECVTPDDARYISDNGQGNPRLVPLWTLDMPVLAHVPIVTPHDSRVDIRDGHVDASFRSGNVRRGVVSSVAAYGAAGTWVRDECHALPQAEVCDRLLDRRSEIRRRFFNAMPSERDVLRVEERGINARLGSDCGVG